MAVGVSLPAVQLHEPIAPPSLGEDAGERTCLDHLGLQCKVMIISAPEQHLAGPRAVCACVSDFCDWPGCTRPWGEVGGNALVWGQGQQ